MCEIKLKKIFNIVLILTLSVLIFEIIEYLLDNFDGDYQYSNGDRKRGLCITDESEIPIILWWTPFGAEERCKKCGDVECYITQDRSYFTNANLKAVLFYGSDFKLNYLPLPRKSDVRWGLFHEESPRNNLIFVHEAGLNLFNYSSTFSRYSDVPLTLVELPGEDELRGAQYFVSIQQKNQLIKDQKLAPLLYIQSNCDTMNDRDLYVAELMKYVPVDSYGQCLNNKKIRDDLDNNYLDKLKSDEFYKFIGQYKFTLAFENANCDDYITEKLWRPLIVGSVPIYYGSPSFKDWLPNNQSAIAVQDFKHPKDLADFINDLLHDDTKYEVYLKHKLSENGITNNHLLHHLHSRPKDYYNIFEYYVRQFECLVCQKINSKFKHEHIEIITKKHYNCSKPKNILSADNDTNGENSWIYMWKSEACTAKLLNSWLSQNKSLDLKKFNDEIKGMNENENC